MNEFIVYFERAESRNHIVVIKLLTGGIFQFARERAAELQDVTKITSINLSAMSELQRAVVLKNAKLGMVQVFEEARFSPQNIPLTR